MWLSPTSSARLGERDYEFPVPHGRSNQVEHGDGPDLRERPIPQAREIYIPDIHIDTLKVKSLKFHLTTGSSLPKWIGSQLPPVHVYKPHIQKGLSTNSLIGATVTDENAKMTFLLEGSRLYQGMIGQSQTDVIKRYLAFRIIVNAMSFEDLVGKRQDVKMREIRNVILAHKQESEFFEGHKAADYVTRQTVDPLLNFMAGEISMVDADHLLPENVDPRAQALMAELSGKVFELYSRDFLDGFRVINNFLCFTSTSIQEISKNELAGVFYRYHSSKALYDLSEYLFNNARKLPPLKGLYRHAKLDMLLHSQNMADCILKDSHNPHSIEGLLEVLTIENIGDVASLTRLADDTNFLALYRQVRHLRNKLIGHMDKSQDFASLLQVLDDLPDDVPSSLVNTIDKAVCETARSHPAIWGRYCTGNQPLNDPNIREISGLKVQPY